LKIWILGAGGQLGTALIDLCQAEKIPFISSTRREVDITDRDLLLKKGKGSGCTHIFNCAAFTDVDGAEEASRQCRAVNALGPENIGVVAAELGMQVVHVSTDYVFDGKKETPYTEEDEPNPLGVYGKTKREGEVLLLQQLPTACIIRTSWVFGVQGKNFISSVLSLLQEKGEIHAVEDQVNRATYNRDLARVMLDLACHSGIFHFANEEPISRFQIVQDFYDEANQREIPIKCEKISPALAKDFPARSPRPAYSVLSTKKVERVLGRKPRLWKTVLGNYLDHVKSRM